MKNYIAAFFWVLWFFLSIIKLRLVSISTDCIKRANRTLAILQSQEMDDLAKEIALKKLALSLFFDFAKIVIITGVSALIPAAILLLFQNAGILEIHKVVSVAASIPFIAPTSLLAAILFAIKKRTGNEL